MQAVVIAAGESKRFWPLNHGIHKSQFKLLGKPLIYWALKGLEEDGIQDVCIVVSKNSSIQEMLAQENNLDMNVSYVVQEKPLGTGNALWQAKNFIKEPFVLLWGNKVGSKELIKKMIETQKKGNADAVLVGAEVKNPWEYGILRLEGDTIVEIVENPEQGTEPSNIGLAGIRILGADFFEYYKSLSSHHEADLIDATNAYIKDKNVSLLRAKEQGLTLKYPWDLFGIMDSLFESQKPHISSSAHVGANVVMNGSVYVGENVVIREGTVIEGPVYIGDNCKIGQNNVLRGPLNLETQVRTGAFMEIKHSIVQEGTVFHSGYIGDSIVGKNCRFGAGFITGNVRLDKEPIHGLPKLGAIVGDNSAFGIHSGTMPGVMIGSNCKVGPATQVFKDIEDNTMCYAKFEYSTKKHNS